MAASEKTGKKTMDQWKPGSEGADAAKVQADGDFGASVKDRAERDYTSRNTKLSDRGASQPMSSESSDAVRDSGAGARDSGPGSASGGDVDTDIIGVGTGGSSIASSGIINAPPGPDDSDGSSDEFASGGHARGEHQEHAGAIGGSKRVPGTTVRREGDVSTGEDAQGADAATNPSARDDDSFAAEISNAEASGADQAGR